MDKIKTGELRFSFDDGESVLVADVFDCQDVVFKLKQDTTRNNIVMNKESEGVTISHTDTPSIDFKHKDKRFRIFVRDTRTESGEKENS